MTQARVRELEETLRHVLRLWDEGMPLHVGCELCCIAQSFKDTMRQQCFSRTEKVNVGDGERET